jgi:hypothetical protein
MKRLAVFSTTLVVAFIVCGMMNPASAGIKAELGDHANLEAGIWAQTWYQWVEDGKVTDTGHEDLNDFMIRRAYLYLKGDVTDLVSFFTHIASDRVGQDGLDKSGLGLGSGVAWRDLWITFNFHPAFMVQAGRMYIPLTRNYGTTSTKAMLTTDLPFIQGGIRGGIFYASKVGRDDGVTFWGNVADGLVQYRLMVSEGVENDANPEDNLRVVGRVSLSLLDPEKGWYNKGTYLGKKRVLSLGLGVDSQDSLMLSGLESDDNLVWTVDAFFDHPVGDGAVTIEGAYINIDNCTTSPGSFTSLGAGDDATDWYINAGYLIPGTHFQPYVRYEALDVDEKSETDFLSIGANYYLKGHNCKISADYTLVGQDSDFPKDDQGIVTIQATVGF